MSKERSSDRMPNLTDNQLRYVVPSLLVEISKVEKEAENGIFRAFVREELSNLPREEMVVLWRNLLVLRDALRRPHGSS